MINVKFIAKIKMLFYMFANSKFILIYKVLFNLSIFLNYIIYVSFNTKNFFIIFFVIILFFFLLNLIIIFKSNKLLFIFFLLILIISLGSAVQVWDARSIFMFNAKRIFFEDNFTTYLETFGFNINYPILYPVLAATLNIFDYWSEIIPKLSILFLSLIPLINIYNEIKKKDQLLFTFLFVFVFEYQILNGDCDVLIGLYSVNNIILINKLINNNSIDNKTYLLSTIDLLLANIIFLLLKPQSWAITFAFVNSLFVVFIFNKIKLKKLTLILLIIIISIIPLLNWKLITLKNYNFIISSDYSFDMLKNNFFNAHIFFKTLFVILDKLLIQKSFMIISIFITFIITKAFYLVPVTNIKNFIKSNIFITLFFTALQYFFAMLIMWLSFSAGDLTLNLEYTVTRYIVPLNMIFLFLGFMFLKSLKK